MVKHINILFVTLLLVQSVLYLFADDVYKQKPVKYITAYSAENIENGLPGSPLSPDERAGYSLALNHQGTLYFIYPQKKVYVASDDLLRLTEISPVPMTFGGHFTPLEQGLLSWDGTGNIWMMDWKGQTLFFIRLLQVLPRQKYEGAYYHSGVLFFLDSKYKLHAITHPSIDASVNKLNYHNPEQTKQLFESDLRSDLIGLSMDNNGFLLLNNKPVCMTVTEIGGFRYQILRQDIYINSTGKSEITISLKINDDDIFESAAIHPSGDIYFLNYNAAKNKHILYMIENNWDLVTKMTWMNRS